MVIAFVCLSCLFVCLLCLFLLKLAETAGSSSGNLEHNFKAKIKPTDNAAAEDELKKVFT